MDLSVIGFPEEAIAGQGLSVAVDRDHAPIVDELHVHGLELIKQVRAFIGVPGEGRSQHQTFAADMIAETVRGLVRADETGRHRVTHRTARVTDRAPGIEAAMAQLAQGMGLAPRSLGDDVDRPAGLALPGESRGRTFQHLEGFHRGGVATRVEAAIGREAIDQQVGPLVDVAREAPDRIGIPGAAKAVLASHAAGQVEQVRQVGCAGLVDQIPIQHAHALR